MNIDAQTNGGNNLNFNGVKTIDDFLSIEISHIKKSKNLIAPTFITDDLGKLERFARIVEERQKISYLPSLKFIHLEGFFITQRGAHPEKYLLDLNGENLEKFYKILSPLRNIKIIFTMAPELISENNIIPLKNFIDGMKTSDREILINLGHSQINSEQLRKKIEFLNERGVKLSGITHFHNAMYGGHYSKADGIFQYLRDNPSAAEYIGLIADGYHVDRGDLLPTLFVFFDKIVLVSDASSASCFHSKKQKLYELGGNINVLTKENQKPFPVVSFIDFFRNSGDAEKLKKYAEGGGKIADLYYSNRIGYRNLAGSAVNLRQCQKYIKRFNMAREIGGTISNRIALDYLILGVKRVHENRMLGEKPAKKILSILTGGKYSKDNLNFLKIHFKKIVKKIYLGYLKRSKFFDEDAKINWNKIGRRGGRGKFIDYAESFRKQNERILEILSADAPRDEKK
ncbi:MAG: hypothetical protein LBB09_03165 [Rickettsiales bacterium]|nr:hypothetical protein [Rickettsiales bacterium]